MCDLIASVPDHYLSFYLALIHSSIFTFYLSVITILKLHLTINCYNKCS